MPIVTRVGVVMSMRKHLFILLLIFATVVGCNLLDRQPAPNIKTTPPYWQSQRQLEELRTFHEKESAKMSQEMHVVRNREMERLEAAGKELEKDKLWQEDYEKTLERRAKWTGWFKKKDKTEAPAISSRTDEANKKTVR